MFAHFLILRYFARKVGELTHWDTTCPLSARARNTINHHAILLDYRTARSHIEGWLGNETANKTRQNFACLYRADVLESPHKAMKERVSCPVLSKRVRVWCNRIRAGGRRSSQSRQDEVSSRPGRNLPVIAEALQVHPGGIRANRFFYVRNSRPRRDVQVDQVSQQTNLHRWLIRVVPREFLSSLEWARGFFMLLFVVCAGASQ